MKEYDVIVLGAGPGGYTAALKTAGNGLKTAVVEKESLGGVCLNVGCIPSKSLLKNAEIARTLRKDCKVFGITCDNLNLDYTAAVDRSRKVSKRLNQGIAFLMKNAGVDVFFGKGKFADPHTIRVEMNDGSEEELHAASIIIACGTKPVEIPGMLPDGEKILNYRQAILQTTLPKRVVIIGGGAIGVEFATVWNSYGSAVTIVEMQNHLLPNEDAEAGAELERIVRSCVAQIFAEFKHGKRACRTAGNHKRFLLQHRVLYQRSPHCPCSPLPRQRFPKLWQPQLNM